MNSVPAASYNNIFMLPAIEFHFILLVGLIAWFALMPLIQSISDFSNWWIKAIKQSANQSPTTSKWNWEFCMPG